MFDHTFVDVLRDLSHDTQIDIYIYIYIDPIHKQVFPTITVDYNSLWTHIYIIYNNIYIHIYIYIHIHIYIGIVYIF